MSDTWTDEDRIAAIGEGWDLFDCDGSGNGPLQMCMIDDPDLWREDRGVTIDRTWDDDTEVWEFVVGNPSPLHEKALAVIRQENPMEHEAILRWMLTRNKERELK